MGGTSLGLANNASMLPRVSYRAWLIPPERRCGRATGGESEGPLRVICLLRSHSRRRCTTSVITVSIILSSCCGGRERVPGTASEEQMARRDQGQRQRIDVRLRRDGLCARSRRQVNNGERGLASKIVSERLNYPMSKLSRPSRYAVDLRRLAQHQSCR